ncbi:MAG TPA: hypothetical protein VGE74_29270 [Gemmata sp.]
MTILSRIMLLVGVLTVVGCSGNGTPSGTATVTGKVTYKGKGLPGGRITFYSAKDPGKSGTGNIKGDGTYEAKLVPQGECKVTVENAYLQMGPPPPMTGEGMAGTETAGQKYVSINPAFTKHESTTVTTTVTGSTYTFDFEVK